MRERADDMATESDLRPGVLGARPTEPPARRPAPWTLRQTAVGLILTMVPWLVISLGAVAISSPSAPRAAPVPRALDIVTGITIFLLGGLLEAAFLIAPLYTARRTAGPAWREQLGALGLRRPAPGSALGVTVIGVIVGIGASALYSWLITVLRINLPNNSDQLLAMGRSEPFTVLGLLAAAAFIAPICEEIFFRGFAFAGLLNGMSVVPAALLSAALFAVAHTDLGSLVPLFLFGLVLAWARWRSDSLWPGIIIHVANNTLAAVMLIPLIFK
jgi:CAAX protease family protein